MYMYMYMYVGYKNSLIRMDAYHTPVKAKRMKSRQLDQDKNPCSYIIVAKTMLMVLKIDCSGLLFPNMGECS